MLACLLLGPQQLQSRHGGHVRDGGLDAGPLGGGRGDRPLPGRALLHALRARSRQSQRPRQNQRKERRNINFTDFLLTPDKKI
jgi:hypothetical protein